MLTGAGLERKSRHKTVHSAQSSRMGWRGRFIIIRQGGTHNSRKRMTQRNSYTAWVGSERLNSEPNSTVLGRHRNVRYHTLEATWSRPCAYSTGATQGKGGLTQSLHSETNPLQGEKQ